MDTSVIKDEVWQIVLKVNRAWTVEGKIDQLKDYFHRDMVAITPNDAKRLRGQSACFAGWLGFTQIAKTNYFKEIDPLIQIYCGGNAAVVTYDYEGEFVINGQTMILRGRDMMVLIKENDRWWVVADQFSPMPKKN